MKTMRSAFLAAGVLAALTATGNAQTVDLTPGIVEGNFRGQFNAESAASVGGLTLATVISGVGTLDSGALFPSPTYVGGVVTTNPDTAYYTFTLGSTSDVDGAGPGTAVNPAVGGANLVLAGAPSIGVVGGQTIVVANYSGGLFSVYLDDADDALPANGNPTTPANYSNPSSFADGSLYLQGLISNAALTFNATTGTGSLSGTINFTAGSVYTSVLQPRGLTTGLFTTNVNNAAGGQVATGYEFAANGLVDVIPEPTTMALFGAGLLPLAGFLRRRRA